MHYYIEMVANAWKWKKGLLSFELKRKILKILRKYFWRKKHKRQTICFKMTYCRNQRDLNQLSYGVIFCCGREKTYFIFKKITSSKHKNCKSYLSCFSVSYHYTKINTLYKKMSSMLPSLGQRDESVIRVRCCSMKYRANSLQWPFAASASAASASSASASSASAASASAASALVASVWGKEYQWN